MESHPTLTKKTFPVYFKALLRGTVRQFKDLGSRAKKQGPRSGSGAIIADAAMAVEALKALVALTKKGEKNLNLLVVAVLKEGKAFVELFIKFISYIEANFKTHRPQILKMIKSLQGATRQMQVLCAHSKMGKTQSLARRVPATKRILEEFILSMKGLLHGLKQSSAFWVGNLKHRNIDGSEVVDEDDAVDEDDETEEDDEDGGEGE